MAALRKGWAAGWQHRLFEAQLLELLPSALHVALQSAVGLQVPPPPPSPPPVAEAQALPPLAEPLRPASTASSWSSSSSSRREFRERLQYLQQASSAQQVLSNHAAVLPLLSQPCTGLRRGYASAASTAGPATVLADAEPDQEAASEPLMAGWPSSSGTPGSSSSSSSSSSGGGNSGGSVLSKFLSRRRGWQHANEDESALWLPEVSARDEATLARAGGKPRQLDSLLRQNRRIQLFNAALRTVPDSQLRLVLEALLQCSTADGSSGSSGAADNSSSGTSSSGTSSSSSRGSSSSNVASSGTPGSPSSCRPDHLTVRTVLHRLSRSDMYCEVDGVMRRLLLAGLPPNYKSFLPWASMHARRGNISGVRQVMALVEEHCGGPTAVSPHYYVQLIRAYTTCGRWKETDRLVQEMRQRGVEPTDHIYRALIVANGRHHRADRARAVFDEMLSVGLTPSIATWAALVNAYADSRQPFRAVEALLDMRKKGLVPSIEVWGAVTKAFARSGDWRRAMEVIELMQAEGLAPNEQIWGCAIESAAVAGKPSVAAALVQRMREVGVAPNVIAYTSLLSSYSATRDVEAAEGVLREMVQAGCPPNAKTYTELMSQLAVRGRHEDCERYFQQMIAEGWPADKVSHAIRLDAILQCWAADRQGRQQLLGLIEARWQEASGNRGPLEPHAFLHQPQGRLMLDLHGHSGWTAQVAVLSTLQRLMAVHEEQLQGGGGGITAHISRLDVITGRGNRSARRGRPVLRELVVEMLQHLLPVGFARDNDGILVLESRNLRRLFDQMLTEGKTFSLEEMQHCLVEPPAQQHYRLY